MIAERTRLEAELAELGLAPMSAPGTLAKHLGPVARYIDRGPALDEEHFIEREEDLGLEEEVDWTALEPEQVQHKPAGREVLKKISLLRRHRGTGPDLALFWNEMAGQPQSIDVVVHLHGYSLSRGKLLEPKDIERRSGLDWSDPERSDPTPGRTRPTVALLPRGHFFGGKTERGYSFPALVTETGLRRLIDFGLDHFARRIGATRVALRRLILTAHSGGGAALLQLLRHNDPHEVHVFDGLYQDPTELIRWAKARIARDQDALAAGEPALSYMRERGGALRVLYRIGTKRNTRPVDQAIVAAIPSGSELRRWYRVEQTSEPHATVPRRYGWRLLADASADLPMIIRPGAPTRELHVMEEEAREVSQFEAATGLLPQIEAEAAAGDLRRKIVAVAEREWERWDRGRLKETDPKALRILTEYYTTAVAPRKGDKLGDATFHAKRAWSAVFVSYVMKTAGAGQMFQYTRGHRYYVAAAKKARQRNSSAFWAYRITEVAPEPGDIVCNARTGSGVTYDNVDDFTVERLAHGDIVTMVRPGQLILIGGNTRQTFPQPGVSDTVGKKTIKIDARGLVVQRSRDPFFAIVKVRDAGAAVAATPGRSLPQAVGATVQQLLQQGLWAAALTLAILTGQRDVNHLTNLVFSFRHPEFKGRRIRPDEKAFAREWLDIRDRLVVPTLNRVHRA